MIGQAGGLFDVGQAIVRRDTFRGRVSSAWQARVVHDTGDDLAWATWPGVEILASTTQIESVRTPRDSPRYHSLRETLDGNKTLGTDILGATILGFQIPDSYFSVYLFFEADGLFRKWYVNFERPFQRTAIGFDTRDLLLDLVVQPDLTHRWKDEEEYDYGREIGLVDDTDHAEIEKAKHRVFALLDQRSGPFDEHWTSWKRDQSWTRPTLPANVTTLPANV